jgi:hypothetical protein
LAGLKIMMGHRQVEQAALLYEFSLERHISADHLLRSIDRFVDLEHITGQLIDAATGDLNRDCAVVISSTIPSAKYSCSGSPLMFWNGRRAIEGLSGRASAVSPKSVRTADVRISSSA